ncbi:phage tail protein, partial [Actinobacillus equuli subsp. equuli]|nr:phage tail protein [Actinobacillus equuli subsp. equuli]
FWARMTDGYNSGKFTEAVEGVPSSDSTQLTSYLDGQITKSHLGQSLIESLQSDINDAVAGEAGVRKSAVANAVSQIITETQARVKALQDEAKARTAAITAEANNRTKAIQAESSNLTKKIQDEANARGTAVTQLQQVDAQQAQLINAVTAKADQAIAGLQEEQTARANADKAEAQARNALTSRVASAESGIAEVRQSIATANSSIAEVSQNLNAKIDSLSVGGRNYVRNSEREIVVTAPNQRYIRVSTGLDSIEEPFVVSAFVKDVDGNNGNKLTVIMADPANANNNEQSQDCEIINGRIIAKFNTLSNPHYTQILLYANSGAYRGSATGTVTYYNIKLELGNVATDWTPAPEDADSAISAVSADLTSYKQTQATKEQATAQQINGLT